MSNKQEVLEMKRVIFFALLMISSVCFGHGYAYAPPPYYHYHTPGGGMVTGYSPHVPMNARVYENYYRPYHGYRGYGYVQPIPQSYYNFSFGQYGGRSGFGFSIGGVR